MKKNKLKKLITDIFVKHKLSKNHAKICSEAIINAELVGAPSHGLSRFCSMISQVIFRFSDIKSESHSLFGLSCTFSR